MLDIELLGAGKGHVGENVKTRATLAHKQRKDYWRGTEGRRCEYEGSEKGNTFCGAQIAKDGLRTVFVIERWKCVWHAMKGHRRRMNRNGSGKVQWKGFHMQAG